MLHFPEIALLTAGRFCVLCISKRFYNRFIFRKIATQITKTGALLPKTIAVF